MYKGAQRMDLGEIAKKLEERIEKEKVEEKSKLAPFETQIIYCRKVKKMSYKKIKKLLKEIAEIDVSISNLCAFYKRRVKTKKNLQDTDLKTKGEQVVSTKKEDKVDFLENMEKKLEGE